MATTTVGSTLAVTMSDNTTHQFKLAYQPFFITGDMVPDGKGGTILAAGYVGIANKPVIGKSGPGNGRPVFSPSPPPPSLPPPPAPPLPPIHHQHPIPPHHPPS